MNDKIKNAETFANEILGAIDAIAGSNDYKQLKALIAERDREIRHAALTEASDAILEQQKEYHSGSVYYSEMNTKILELRDGK